MPKVSVVLPSLNVREYIAECLQSVVDQTLKDIEIICVDAGSNDGTLEILREYEQKDPRIKVIFSDRRSYGYQVNCGMDAANGEYLAVVETDDYISPDMYENLCMIADKNNLDILKADFYRFFGDGEQRTFQLCNITEPLYYGRTLSPSKKPEIMTANTIYTWAGIYRLSFLRENNIRHNESAGASYQDNGFWFQTFTQANRVRFVKHPYYHLRRDNPNSSLHSREKVYCICDEYDFIWSFLEAHPAIMQKYQYVYAYYRYRNYAFTFERISPEFKHEFVCRFAEDFRKIANEGLLKEQLFTNHEWLFLHEVMDNPDYVFYRQAESDMLAEDKLEKMPDSEKTRILLEHLHASNAKLEYCQKEYIQLAKSSSYKVGQIVTFIPRKFARAIQYYQKYGVRKTIAKLFQ